MWVSSRKKNRINKRENRLDGHSAKRDKWVGDSLVVLIIGTCSGTHICRDYALTHTKVVIMWLCTQVQV